jgi:hypothetical protein
VPDKDVVKLVTSAFSELLNDQEKRTVLGERAMQLVLENRGATPFTMKTLERILTDRVTTQQRSEVIVSA